jgi:hypothetical protein
METTMAYMYTERCVPVPCKPRPDVVIKSIHTWNSASMDRFRPDRMYVRTKSWRSPHTEISARLLWYPHAGYKTFLLADETICTDCCRHERYARPDDCSWQNACTESRVPVQCTARHRAAVWTYIMYEYDISFMTCWLQYVVLHTSVYTFYEATVQYCSLSQSTSMCCSMSTSYSTCHVPVQCTARQRPRKYWTQGTRL